MARTDNLSNFLTDVADAIREKKGSQEEILASDFDTEITNLPSQGVYQTKSVTVTENGTQIITPDQDYDALDQLNLTVRVEGTSATLDITNNDKYVDDDTLIFGPSYTQKTYIRSSGTQYIDTGIIGGKNITIELDAQLLEVANNTWIFGSQPAGNKNDRYSLFTYQNNNLYCYIGSAHYDATSFSSGAKERHVFKLDKGIFYIDGEQKIDRSDVASFSTGFSTYIFSVNSNGYPDAFSKMKVYRCKIWDNNILVRDMIPAVDENGVVCMYDKVSYQFFYNQGTGDFTTNPDEPNHTELDYIKSTKTQYIDTGIVASSNIKIECKLELNDASIYSPCFGAWDQVSNPNQLLFLISQGHRTNGCYDFGAIDTNYGSHWLINVRTTNTKIIAKYASQELYIHNFEGTQLGFKQSVGSFDSNLNIDLFAVHTNTGHDKGKLKIYYCKIWNNNTLVRNFIPVERSNGEACMYDTVSQTYFTNELASNFITGPEK